MIRSSAFLLLIFQLISYVGKAQDAELKILAKLPTVLRESSALEITKQGSIWTIVDGKYPVLYNINTKGEIVKAIHLNHKNNDWEALAQDAAGNFYIGGFGNNKNDRHDLKILKVSPPDSITDNLINAGVIRFSYPDQKSFPPSITLANFDMEAMICFKNSLYLFSKNRTKPFTGYTKMYKVPNTPGEYVAQLIDSVYLGHGIMLDTWVTGADISPDNKTVALLSHDKVWLFSCFKGDQFLKGKMKLIDLKNFSQKEGICFINNTELYITDELTHNILGGNLYHLKLKKNFSDECKK